MHSILKIRRDWSLFHFKIRRDRSPHKILKIRRDWNLPFGEIGVPLIYGDAKVEKHFMLVLFCNGAIWQLVPSDAPVKLQCLTIAKLSQVLVIS